MQRARLVITAVAVLAIEVVGVVVARTHHGAQPSVIVLDPVVGDTFQVLPALSPRPPVSALAAWAHVNGSPAPIPAQVRVDYGLLTEPIGPDGHGGLRYHLLNRPAWAFSTRGCLPPSSPIGVLDDNEQTLTVRVGSMPCRSWHFIDARTDRDLGGIG
jgi:hypothetical protein